MEDQDGITQKLCKVSREVELLRKTNLAGIVKEQESREKHFEM